MERDDKASLRSVAAHQCEEPVEEKAEPIKVEIVNIEDLVDRATETSPGMR